MRKTSMDFNFMQSSSNFWTLKSYQWIVKLPNSQVMFQIMSPFNKQCDNKNTIIVIKLGSFSTHEFLLRKKLLRMHTTISLHLLHIIHITTHKNSFTPKTNKLTCLTEQIYDIKTILLFFAVLSKIPKWS